MQKREKRSYFFNYNSAYSQIIIQLLFDLIAIAVSYSIQYYVRFESGKFPVSVHPDLAQTLVSGVVMVIYWFLLFFFSGMYKNWYDRSPFDELFKILQVTLVGCALIVFFILWDSTGRSPRLLFLLYFVNFSVFLILGRFLARRLQRNLRVRGIISIPAIIFGTFNRAQEFLRKAQSAKAWGYKPIGLVLQNPEEYQKAIQADSRETLGIAGELRKIIEERKPEEIIISTDKPKHSLLLEVAAACSEYDVKIKIEPDLYSIFTGQTRAQIIYGIPLIQINTQLLKPWQAVIKRIFDICFSVAVLLIGLPFWVLIGVIVKLDSEGPVFYSQMRVGKDGKLFRIYKFRSMRTDADKGVAYTEINDPRVTRFGRFIRATHLDEIPQFLNVLLGDMSVVGPRPERPSLVEEYSRDLPYYKRRLKVRPGITGWWQVKYEAFVITIQEIDNRLKDDFYYIENMSLLLDIEIIFRTIWCVVRGQGQT